MEFRQPPHRITFGQEESDLWAGHMIEQLIRPEGYLSLGLRWFVSKSSDVDKRYPTQNQSRS